MELDLFQDQYKRKRSRVVSCMCCKVARSLFLSSYSTTEKVSFITASRKRRERVFLLKNFLINNCLIDTFYIEIAEKSKSLVYKQMNIVSKVA